MRPIIAPTFQPVWRGNQGPHRHHWLRNLLLFCVLSVVLTYVLLATVLLLVVWAAQWLYAKLRHRITWRDMPGPSGMMHAPCCSCGQTWVGSGHGTPTLLWKRQMGAPGRKLSRWMNS